MKGNRNLYFGNRTIEAIRDQIVFGLACEETRIALMETEDLDLNKAFRKADLRERAHQDNKMVTRGGGNSMRSSGTSDVNRLGNGFQKKYKSKEPSASGSGVKTGNSMIDLKRCVVGVSWLQGQALINVAIPSVIPNVSTVKLLCIVNPNVENSKLLVVVIVTRWMKLIIIVNVMIPVGN